MKLSEHVNKLRLQIEAAFDKQFARLGIGATKNIEPDKLPANLHAKRKKLDEMLKREYGCTFLPTQSNADAESNPDGLIH